MMTNFELLHVVKPLVEALEQIRDEDSHPVVKGQDFDVIHGRYAAIADEALQDWKPQLSAHSSIG